MKLNKDSWHFKIYRRWLELKTRDTWFGDSKDVSDMLYRVKGTRTHSLCLYMRVALFWGPLKAYFFSAKALYRPRTERKPNIIWEYLKAKKQKICPVISFDEE